MADSTVDLAELEMAFAKDPASDAFIALSAAYLEQGRFMEAMVVCKKGIRSQPDSLEGRLLLAKVYAGQGKVPKALEEVNKLLETDDSIADGHFLRGQLEERSGRFDEAIEAFKQAVTLDRGHKEAKEALKEKGVDFDPGPSEEEIAAQKAAEEEAAAAKAAEEAAAAQAAQEAAQRAQAPMAGAVPMPLSDPGVSGPSPAAVSGPYPHAPGSMPPTPVTNPGMNPSAPAAMSGGYQSAYDPLAQRMAQQNSKFGLGFSVGLGGVLLVVLVGFILFLRSYKAEQEEIAEYTKAASKNYARDTTRGLKAALEKYEGVLKIDDEHPMALSRLAYIYNVLSLERGMYKEYEDAGKAALEKALKYAGKEPATHAAYIIRLAADGKGEEATKAADEARSKFKDEFEKSARLWVAEGKAQLHTGDLASLKKSLETMSKAPSPVAKTFAGDVYRRLGELDRARVALDGAIKLESDHDPARALRALLILGQKDIGNLPVALDDVSNILDLGKDYVGETQRDYALIGRAEFYRIGGREDEAQRDFDQVLRRRSRDAEVKLIESRWLVAAKKRSEALDALEKALNLDPYRLNTYAEYVTEAANAKKFKDAEKVLADGVRIFGEEAALLEARVHLMLRQKKFDAALSYLEKKKSGAAKVALINREIGRVHLFKRDYAKAIDSLREAAEKSKGLNRLEKADIFVLLGRALAISDSHGDAIQSFKSAIDVARGYAPAYYYLGLSFKAQGMTGAAREAFQEAAKLDPTSSIGARAKKAAASL